MVVYTLQWLLHTAACTTVPFGHLYSIGMGTGPVVRIREETLWSTLDPEAEITGDRLGIWYALSAKLTLLSFHLLVDRHTNTAGFVWLKAMTAQ